MCTLFEEIARDSKVEANIETAREMLRDNEPIEKIVKYSRLPEETILELQKDFAKNNEISISFDEMKAEMLEDKEFKSEYEKLKPVYKDIKESIVQSQN